jgi:hypothetical protein
VRQLPSVSKNAISLNRRYLNVFPNSCGEPIYDSTSTDLDRGSVLPAFGGCNRKESGGSIAEPYLPDEASVVFELEPMQGGGGWQWIGTYESQGKMARFRVEFGPAKAIPG